MVLSDPVKGDLKRAYLILLLLVGVAGNPAWSVESSLALPPFREIGPMPSRWVTGDSLREGVQSLLEDRFGFPSHTIFPPTREATTWTDPNTSLIPPSYRSFTPTQVGDNSGREDWVRQARRLRVEYLVLGTYDESAGALRLTAEAVDPFADETVFRCVVEGATTERFSLETKLAEGIAIELNKIREAVPDAAVSSVGTVEAAPVSAEVPAEEDSAETRYENGYALTRRFDQTNEMRYLDGAIEEYRAALAIDPDHFRSLNNLGTVLHRKGELEEALRYYQRVLEINPRYARAMENAALAYRSLERNAEAIEMWKRALEYEEREDVKKVIQEALAQVESAAP